MKNLKQLLKMSVSFILTFVLMTNGLILESNAKSPMKDGEYSIGATVLNVKTGEKSMADDSITKPLKLVVSKDVLTIHLTMADSMYALAVDDGTGKFVLAKEVSEDVKAATFTYAFPVKSTSEPILLEAVVAAMGRKVSMKLVLDEKSLTALKTSEVAIKTPAVKAIGFEKTSFTVATASGKNKLQLKVLGTLDNGKKEVIAKGIKFTVNDTKLASVSSTGLLEMKPAAKGKTVIVKAEYQGKTTSVKVTGK